ncbi:MAG: 3-hydroxyacyl-CoA dehydrogenase NAD-binding domain-containing protein, partial [Alphaproteobacteria bacterium]|nr:3-hydroxyacyl-CoA dehydrogenase NAD-binding domain-containing protein [Alphaproteobacteria bacterium]
MADSVGIVGAGRMGSGIAQVCAEADIPVFLIDARVKSLEAAMKGIEANLDKKIAEGKLAPEKKADILAKISTSTDFASLKKCALGVEAVLENAGIKSFIHSRMREKGGRNIVIATNTVNLSINKLSEDLELPNKFLGMVFGYPPQDFSDVKIISSKKTDSSTVALATKIVRAIGKNPIPTPDRKPPFVLSSTMRMIASMALMFLAFIAGVILPWVGLSYLQFQIAMTVFALFGMIMLAITFFSFKDRFVRLRKIIHAMTGLASDDMSIVVPDLKAQDEYGDIARIIDIFKMINIEMDRLADQEIKKGRAAVEKRTMLEKLAEEFERDTADIVRSLTLAATDLNSDSKHLLEMSEQTNRQSSSAAIATDEASNNVHTVASAAEELSASIGEINRQVSESTRIAQEAVLEVKRTDATVSTLSDAASQIGDVVDLIRNISEQTNLLALNATIEAARAGDSGKGFAVVASEVKNLANQTGTATEDIAKKIVTIQAVSTEAVNAIRKIGEIIEHINKVSEIILYAVQQQEGATKEISHNVQQAFVGTTEVSSNIVSVAHAASESSS